MEFIKNLFRKHDETADLTPTETTEATPFAVRTVKLTRQINVHTGAITVKSQEYGPWSVKPGAVSF
jgi:hypothetical protein